MFDALTAFVMPGGAQSLVGAAGTLVQIGQTIDLLGAGVGVAPPNIIGNRPSGFYGVNPGIGKFKPEIEVDFSVNPATGNGATIEFALQYAPDTGAVGGYLPGTWEDANTTGFKAATEYTTALPVKMDVGPAPPNTPTPRFVRLIMRPASGTNLNAGTVNFAGLTIARADLVNAQTAPNNFVQA